MDALEKFSDYWWSRGKNDKGITDKSGHMLAVIGEVWWEDVDMERFVEHYIREASDRFFRDELSAIWILAKLRK